MAFVISVKQPSGATTLFEADGVEVDVVMHNGMLKAAHDCTVLAPQPETKTTVCRNAQLFWTLAAGKQSSQSHASDFGMGIQL